MVMDQMFTLIKQVKWIKNVGIPGEGLWEWWGLWRNQNSTPLKGPILSTNYYVNLHLSLPSLLSS